MNLGLRGAVLDRATSFSLRLAVSSCSLPLMWSSPPLSLSTTSFWAPRPGAASVASFTAVICRWRATLARLSNFCASAVLPADRNSSPFLHAARAACCQPICFLPEGMCRNGGRAGERLRVAYELDNPAEFLLDVVEMNCEADPSRPHGGDHVGLLEFCQDRFGVVSFHGKDG